MRISTSQMTSAGVRELLLRQSELQYTQLQLSTQKRVLKPSDDPVAATSISFLKSEIAQLEQYKKNGEAAQADNELEETALASTTNILLRIKELAVSTGNGTYSTQQQNAIKIELKERLEELLGLANTQNAKGDYVFAGSVVKSKPFSVDASGNVIYSGDQSQRNIRVSSGVTVASSDSGFDVFSNVKDGNGTFSSNANTANTGTGVISNGSYNGATQFIAEPYDISFSLGGGGQLEYTVTGRTSGTVEAGPITYEDGADISFQGVQVKVSGTPQAGDTFGVEPSKSQDLFSSVLNMVKALDSFVDTPVGRAELRNIMSSEQNNLDRHMDSIDTTRAKVGSRLNVIESETNSNLSLIVATKASLSTIEDLDVVEASTRLSQQLVVLEAAQASFVRVRNLNLFNFLR